MIRYKILCFMVYCGGSLCLLSAGALAQEPRLGNGQPANKVLKINQIDPYLKHQWNIKRVLNAKNHKLKYIPRYFSHIVLSDDMIDVRDGVNSLGASITYYVDGSVSIGGLGGTQKWGETDPIRISNAKKMVWDKETNILQLITSTEIYEFERSKPGDSAQN